MLGVGVCVSVGVNVSVGVSVSLTGVVATATTATVRDGPGEDDVSEAVGATPPGNLSCPVSSKRPRIARTAMAPNPTSDVRRGGATAVLVAKLGVANIELAVSSLRLAETTNGPFS